jgi:hypothetical protein
MSSGPYWIKGKCPCDMELHTGEKEIDFSYPTEIILNLTFNFIGHRL